MRSSGLVFAVSLLLAGLAPAQDDDVLRLGLVPHIAREELVADYRPLADHVAGRTGRRVEIVVPDRYAGVYDGLASGAIDLAVLPPFVYVEAVRELGALPLATLVGHGGRTTYSSLIVVREDGPIGSLADLAGRSFAFVDPKSSSGYLFPVALFIREGLDPTRVFGRVVLAGDHERAIRMVEAGEVDGAATNDLVLARVAGSAVSPAGFRILARSPAVPQQSIVARRDLDPALLETARAALLDYRPPAGSRPIDVHGWVEHREVLYDEVRRLLAFRRERVALGLIPGDGPEASGLLVDALRASGRFRLLAAPAGAFDGVAPAERSRPERLAEAGRKAGIEYWIGLSRAGYGEGRSRLSLDLYRATGEREETIQADVPDPVELARAVDALVAQLAGRFLARGFVTAVDEDRAALDLGRRDGLRPGDLVEFFVWGEATENPLTGRLGPRLEIRIGEGVVEEVDLELATARILERSAALLPGVWAKVRPAGPGAGASTFAPASGSLRVLSEPAGASIRLDGRETGERTPHTFAGLAPRDYVVSVVLDGYRESRGVARVEGATEPTVVHLDLVPYWETDLGLWVLGAGGSLLALAGAWGSRRWVRKARSRLALSEDERERLGRTLPLPVAQALACSGRKRSPLPPRAFAEILERFLATVLVREDEERSGRRRDVVELGREWWDLRDSLLARGARETAGESWMGDVVGFYATTGRRWGLAEGEGRRLRDVVLPSVAIVRDLFHAWTVEDLLHAAHRGDEPLLVEIAIREAGRALEAWRLVAVGPVSSPALELAGTEPRPAALARPIEDPGLYLVDPYERRILDLSPYLVYLPLPRSWTGPRLFFLDRVLPASPEASEYVSFDRGEAEPERTVLVPEAWSDALAARLADPAERADAMALLAGQRDALRRAWAARRDEGR